MNTFDRSVDRHAIAASRSEIRAHLKREDRFSNQECTKPQGIKPDPWRCEARPRKASVLKDRDKSSDASVRCNQNGSLYIEAHALRVTSEMDSPQNRFLI
ncbi:hypothetical protein HN011_005726 [Eciton burchellii]|nr:hypothetical protein HN011_005726 [Eciton burchellii]